MLKRQVLLLAAFLALSAQAARASDNPAMDADIARLEHQWAQIKYQVKDEDTQLHAMDALAKDAAAVVRRYPNRAEPLIWDGIVTSTEAGMKSMFGALSLAEDARRMLEQAEKIDPKALDGGALTSLGALYYLVSGFPLGFGDDDRARHYLEQAVALRPDGLDANFFYGDFLYRQGEYDKAARVLGRALAAPSHPDRPVWDAGRRAEIRNLLEKVQKKLASAS